MRLAKLLIVLYGLVLPCLAAGEEMIAANPDRIKAAFLRNFASYVVWPEAAFPDAGSSWHICILGPDPFGNLLDETLEGRIEQGRPFEIFRNTRLDASPSCQILYVAFDQPVQRRAVLAALQHRPVLTVGDADDFLLEGGMIRLQVGERVEMSINLDQAKAASLRIQTKMLEVSRQVLENGILRTRR